MSTTHMPGFTAAAALYPTAGRYRTSGAAGRRSGSRAIEPQLPIGFCMADCDFQYPSDPLMASVCKFGCFDSAPGDGGGGGGGGGGVSPRACIQCKARCNRKPVSQRAACKADCDDTVC
jgi:hypothetical protein